MSNAPSTVGRYQVLHRIGQGGMGALYLAHDPKLDRQIVIKLLVHDNDELRERFSREARSVARLRHPHIVTIFDVGEDNGQPFLAMEYVQGQTLAEIIRNKQPLATVAKIKLIEEMCAGLGFAHRAGIIHRDVKPANAMVDVSGALKILDFGIARIAEAAGMTQAGMLIGTLNYMSPEQVVGETVDNRCDIFAVGAVFYELLAYQQAFPGGLKDGILNRILHAKPEPLEALSPGIDSEIVGIVDRAIEKSVDRRYKDLDSMGLELKRVRLRLEALEPLVETAIASPANQPTVIAVPNAQRRTADREEIARRRRSQIHAHLDAAERAFSAGEFEASIAACEEALLLDADEKRAIELLERARVALDDRQVDEWLTEAEQEIQRGALTAARAMVDQAIALNPSSKRAAELRKTVDDAIRERETAKRRAEQVRQALWRGHSHFDKGLFKEALAAADEALELEPELLEASKLKAGCLEAIDAHEREALERRARGAVRDARRLLSAGNAEAALDLLTAFEPSHELVQAAAVQIREEAERIAERRRQEAALRLKQERIATELLKARTEIGHQQYTIALDRLHGLEEAEGDSAEIARLLQEATAAKAAFEREQAIAQQVAQHLADASARFAVNDLSGALAKADAALELDSAHAPARALRHKVEEAIKAEEELREAEARQRREREQAVAAAIEKAKRATSHEAAIAELQRALELDASHREARKLLEERQQALAREQAEARQRREREQAVAAAIEKAKRATSHEAAIAELQRALELDASHREARKLLERRQEALSKEKERERLQQEATRALRELEPTLLVHDQRDLDPSGITPGGAVTPDPRNVPTLLGAMETADRTQIASGGARNQLHHGSDTLAETILAERPTEAFRAAFPPADVAHEPSKASTPVASSNRSKWVKVYAIPGAAAGLLLVGSMGYWLFGRSEPAHPSTVTPPVTTTVNQPPLQPNREPGTSGVTGTVNSGGSDPSGKPDYTPDRSAISAVLKARAEFGRGDLEQGLTTVMNALKLRPKDTELGALLNEQLTRARAGLGQARDTATSAGAPVTGSPSYQEGERLARAAAAQEKAGQKDRAVRSMWTATSAFSRALEDGKVAADHAAADKAASDRAAADKAAADRAAADRAAADKAAADRAAADKAAADRAAADRAAADRAAADRAAADRAAADRAAAERTNGAAVDQSAIRAVLQAYAEAYTNLDSGAVKRVFPDVNQAALARAFSQMKSQRVQIEGEQIVINGPTATITCTWDTSYEGLVGGQQHAAPKVTLKLQKSGNVWIITERR